MTDKEAAKILHEGTLLCVSEAQKFFDEGFDISKAANGRTNPDTFKEQIFNNYIKLYRDGKIIEAYCLLRMAFGHLSTEDLMDIYDDGLALTERLAYQAAEHDKVPF